MSEDTIVLAKDITGCDDCPIFEKDCPGGVTGTPNGYSEPPCTSWTDETEVYEGMYANIDY